MSTFPDAGSRRVMIPALPIGNLAAVANMVRKVGGVPEITANPQDLYSAERVIIAGVGAFDAGMESLEEGGWVRPLDDLASGGRIPLLGICHGMQLMCRRSDEGRRAGLSWFDAEVARITHPPGSDLKVPHMGWNEIDVVNPSPLFPREGERLRFYFAHSYHVVCADPSAVVATVRYGVPLTAAVAGGNLHGVQFHPEKSHSFGMSVVSAFLGYRE